jgi:creatinine amidohydrolase/Fe(II)-dependent formamide hydrolase-like protein
VRYLAGLIAQRLGNAVVAPVLSYVPEGAVFPPVAHMRFTGTITIPDATFESILESTARSFKQHGLHTVIFLGDHGGYQKSEKRAVDKINKAWASDPTAHAYALSAYYEAAQTSFLHTLRKKGFSDAEIGLHAGLLDTSLTLAVDPTLVRTDLLAQGAKSTPAEGVYGDPRRSTAELGQIGVQMIVEESVQAIQRVAKQP